MATAHDQIRKMLDELMGSGRDGTVPDDLIPYSDSRVCRSFLLNCCPHDVLCNTRMDMGDCPKVHDPALRADFDKAQQKKDHFYDLDALDHLERFFEDCDRKNEISKKRLVETQEELSTECADKANKVLEMNETIGKTLAEAEKLGEEGKVDESLKLMEKVDEIRKEKQLAEQEYRESMPASSYQQQKLRVCEVCGAYLGIHDNDRRLADHFGGKLHMGFVFLREKMAELRTTAEERRALREKDRLSSRSSRRRSRSPAGGYYGSKHSSSSYERRGGRRYDDDYDDSYDSSSRYKRKRHSRSRSRSNRHSRSRSSKSKRRSRSKSSKSSSYRTSRNEDNNDRKHKHSGTNKHSRKHSSRSSSRDRGDDRRHKSATVADAKKIISASSADETSRSSRKSRDDDDSRIENGD